MKPHRSYRGPLNKTGKTMNEKQLSVRNSCDEVVKILRKRLTIDFESAIAPQSLPPAVLQGIHDEIVTMRNVLDPEKFYPAFPKDLIENWRHCDLFGELLSVADKYLQLQEIQKPKTLHDILKLIRRRPAMYLGSVSLKALSSFIDGYEAALSVNNLYENKIFASSIFSHYLVLEHKFDMSCIIGGWEWYLSKSSADEQEAFDKFYIFYDEFSRLEPISTHSLGEEAIRDNYDDALKLKSRFKNESLPYMIEIIRLYPKKWCLLKYYFPDAVRHDGALYKNYKRAVESVKFGLGIPEDMWLPIKVAQRRSIK